MPLSAADKAEIKQLSGPLAAHADEWGADILARLFAVYPTTKTYFLEFHDFTAHGPRVIKHGGVVVTALANAANHLDDLPGHLAKLALKHGQELKVDPHNFYLIAHCILVTLSTRLKEFKPATHCAADKFLLEVAQILSSKYR
ncbi:hemoglobin subunit alpha-like [Heptranchias perlo]|uniref:hemoglobin subunit alpha-like n=1 Tax=Heptranchias perlo TaxID=212740 RepID=UPI003559665A